MRPKEKKGKEKGRSRCVKLGYDCPWRCLRHVPRELHVESALKMRGKPFGVHGDSKLVNVGGQC